MCWWAGKGAAIVSRARHGSRVADLRRDGIEAGFPDRRRGRGRREERDQRACRFGRVRAGDDAGREDGFALRPRRQRSGVIDAGHRQQLADLLEANLRVAPRDQLADRPFADPQLALDPVRSRRVAGRAQSRDTPRWRSTSSAIEAAASSVRVSASTELMSGFRAPARTATPIRERTRSTRLPAATRPRAIS